MWCVDLAAKNLGGAWRRVHRWIWPIFVMLYKLAFFLSISGEWSVNRWLEDADLEHGIRRRVSDDVEDFSAHGGA